MPSSSTRRIHLIDLVMAVLFCGLVVATFTSSAGIHVSNVSFLAAGAVAAVWYSLRYRRGAPTCSECGARFYPVKGTDVSKHCPHCGGPQSPIRQTSVRRSVVLCLIGLLLAISAMASLTFTLDLLPESDPSQPSRFAALSIAIVFAALSALLIAWLFATRSRSAQPSIDRICEACGKLIPAELPAPTVCPNCRSRKLTKDQLQKEHARGRRSTVLGLVIVAIAGIWSTAMLVRLVLISNDWASLFSNNWASLLACGTVSVGALYYSWAIFVFLLGSRRLRGIIGEPAILAKAQACAGEEGTVTRDGSATIWYSGPEDPVPMLRQENAVVHRRFAAILGETDIADPPLTILCFHTRATLLKFYKEVFPNVDFSAYLGVYLQQPWNVMTFCTEQVPGRLDDPNSLARSLYSTVLLEQVFGPLSASWLQAGIVRALGAGAAAVNSPA